MVFLFLMGSVILLIMVFIESIKNLIVKLNHVISAIIYHIILKKHIYCLSTMVCLFNTMHPNYCT